MKTFVGVYASTHHLGGQLERVDEGETVTGVLSDFWQYLATNILECGYDGWLQILYLYLSGSQSVNYDCLSLLCS